MRDQGDIPLLVAADHTLIIHHMMAGEDMMSQMLQKVQKKLYLAGVGGWLERNSVIHFVEINSF